MPKLQKLLHFSFLILPCYRYLSSFPCLSLQQVSRFQIFGSLLFCYFIIWSCQHSKFYKYQRRKEKKRRRRGGGGEGAGGEEEKEWEVKQRKQSEIIDKEEGMLVVKSYLHCALFLVKDVFEILRKNNVYCSETFSKRQLWFGYCTYLKLIDYIDYCRYLHTQIIISYRCYLNKKFFTSLVAVIPVQVPVLIR